MNEIFTNLRGDLDKTNQISVLITGATGLLGSTLVPTLRARGFKIITHAQSQDADYKSNLSLKGDCYKLLDSVNPDIIINLVGLTSVELCEEQPNLAYLVNTKTVENVANWILDTKFPCHLIHISTDHMYDGEGIKPEETIDLKNMYAFSKYAAEISATRVSSTILRTNFFGKSNTLNRQSITDWVYMNLKSSKSIKVFDDVYFSPLSINTISQLMPLIITKKIVGTFNLGSNNGMTKADFDFIFADKLELPTESMKRINSSEFTSLKAERPKDMRMDCSKFETHFDLKLPNLIDEITNVVSDYKS